MQADHHDHREKPEHKPFRHADSENGFHHADDTASHLAVLEHIRPEQGKRPRGHHVGKDENSGNEFLAFQIRSCNKPGDRTANCDSENAGTRRHYQRVFQRHPEVDAAPLISGKQFPEMMSRPGSHCKTKHFFLRARMHSEHIRQHRHHREK